MPKCQDPSFMLSFILGNCMACMDEWMEAEHILGWLGFMRRQRFMCSKSFRFCQAYTNKHKQTHTCTSLCQPTNRPRKSRQIISVNPVQWTEIAPHGMLNNYVNGVMAAGLRKTWMMPCSCCCCGRKHKHFNKSSKEVECSVDQVKSENFVLSSPSSMSFGLVAFQNYKVFFFCFFFNFPEHRLAVGI